MQFIHFLSIFLGAFIVNCSVHAETAEESHQPHTVIVSSPRVEVRIGGMVSEEYLRAHNLLTLRSDLPDTTNFFRHRTDVNLAISYRQEGDPLFDGFLGMCSNVNWRNEDIFTRVQPQQVTIMTDSVTGMPIQTPTPHEHPIRTPLVFLREGWLNLHLDNVTTILKHFPTILKAGYFPYQCGRGVSLGASDEGGIHYMGFEIYDKNVPNSPLLAPGFKLTTHITEDIALEAYFSKWRETLDNPWFDNGVQNYPRLDRQKEKPFGRQDDRDLWVGKIMLHRDIGHSGHLYAEPYALQMHSRAHQIELNADSIITLGTVGMMMNFATSNWHINGEFACQWGSQLMHPIDRNYVMLSKSSSGVLNQEYSHVFTEVRTLTDKTNLAAPVSTAVVNTNTTPNLPRTFANATVQNSANDNLNLPVLVFNDFNRSIDRQGEEILTEDQTNVLTFRSNALNSVSTSNVNFPMTEYRNAPAENILGGQRFRPQYRINLGGIMALLDIGYTTDSKLLSFNTATGYISGDAYPYNNEVNKHYKGFIPLRDRTYNGLTVISKALFELRWLPRPTNINEKALSAYNNDSELTDLMFIGWGGQIRPFDQRERLTLGTNALIFFNNANLKKWDKSGTYPDPNIEPFRAHLAQPNNYDFQGWTSANQFASHYLGTEWNCSLEFKATEDCIFSAWGFVFIPGNFYKDLEGQPNVNTIVYDTSNKPHYQSLGTSSIVGFSLGIKCNF